MLVFTKIYSVAYAARFRLQVGLHKKKSIASQVMRIVGSNSQSHSH
jgi:hypothetical protein